MMMENPTAMTATIDQKAICSNLFIFQCVSHLLGFMFLPGN